MEPVVACAPGMPGGFMAARFRALLAALAISELLMGSATSAAPLTPYRDAPEWRTIFGPSGGRGGAEVGERWVSMRPQAFVEGGFGIINGGIGGDALLLGRKTLTGGA